MEPACRAPGARLGTEGVGHRGHEANGTVIGLPQLIGVLVFKDYGRPWFGVISRAIRAGKTTATWRQINALTHLEPAFLGIGGKMITDSR